MYVDFHGQIPSYVGGGGGGEEDSLKVHIFVITFQTKCNLFVFAIKIMAHLTETRKTPSPRLWLDDPELGGAERRQSAGGAEEEVSSQIN